MGLILDVVTNQNSIVITFLRILSIGISGDSEEGYYTSTLHLRLLRLEITTSISWRI